METVWRVAVIYLFLMVALRTMGKRDVGRLAPMELVILLLIPELVSQGLIREDFSITNAIIGVSALLGLAFLTSVITFMSKPIAHLTEGKPTVLVQHGFLVPEHMSRERISPDEVLAQMHKTGLEHMAQVKWGILETDGTISFVPWEQGAASPQQDEQQVYLLAILPVYRPSRHGNRATRSLGVRQTQGAGRRLGLARRLTHHIRNGRCAATDPGAGRITRRDARVAEVCRANQAGRRLLCGLRPGRGAATGGLR